MTRSLSAAVAFAVLALAGAASAQTWGQPVYLNAYGRPVGGTPLSEVESRSYIATGRWADGYSDRPQVYVPAPGYGLPHPARGHDYGYGRRQDSHPYGYSTGRYGHGHGHNAPRRRSDRPARTGYRDVWGYNDDRPPSARGWTDDRHGRRYGRDCGCGDVYLYDR
jgi:hypothetical protein